MALRRLDAGTGPAGPCPITGDSEDADWSGDVEVRGIAVTKVNRQVAPDDPIKVADRAANNWVSRGSGKLIGALDAFPEGGIEGGYAWMPGRQQVVSPRYCFERGAATVRN